MHTWQRFTAIAIGVAALHGAALWAVHSYRARTDAADKPAAMETRTVQPLMSVKPIANHSVPLAPPLLAVSPKSAAIPATKNKSTDNAALPATNLSAQATTARAELLMATKNQTFAATTPAGKTAPLNSSGVDFTAPQPAATAFTTTASSSVTAATSVPQKTAGIAAEEVNLVRPSYTQLTQRLDQTGRVQIAFEVDTDGHTVNARVAQSSGFSTLDTAALDAARKTRYKPAMCGDKKVSSKYTRNYAFGVDPSPDPPQPFIDCSAS